MANQEHLSIVLNNPSNISTWQAQNLEQSFDLRGADLSRADLSRADLRGAKHILVIPNHFDTRGYWPALLVEYKDGLHIQVGCRNYTLTEARNHWGAGYDGVTTIGYGYVWLCDYAEACHTQDDGTIIPPKLEFK